MLMWWAMSQLNILVLQPVTPLATPQNVLFFILPVVLTTWKCQEHMALMALNMEVAELVASS